MMMITFESYDNGQWHKRAVRAYAITYNRNEAHMLGVKVAGAKGRKVWEWYNPVRMVMVDGRRVSFADMPPPEVEGLGAFTKAIIMVLWVALAIALMLAAMGCTPSPTMPPGFNDSWVDKPTPPRNTACKQDQYKEVCWIVDDAPAP